MKHFIQTLAHKYLKRTGSPGSYDYFYKEPEAKVGCPKCGKATHKYEMIWQAKTKKPQICFDCYEKIRRKLYPPIEVEPEPLKSRKLVDDFIARQKARLKEADFDNWPDSDVESPKLSAGERRKQDYDEYIARRKLHKYGESEQTIKKAFRLAHGERGEEEADTERKRKRRENDYSPGEQRFKERAQERREDYAAYYATVIDLFKAPKMDPSEAEAKHAEAKEEKNKDKQSTGQKQKQGGSGLGKPAKITGGGKMKFGGGGKGKGGKGGVRGTDYRSKGLHLHN
jgi:hypothetical protein